MYKRNITDKLLKSLSRSPVVLLTGARQTGKTTLIKEIGNELGYKYITFDDIRYLSGAKSDPIGFIESLEKPVILDEVQRIPELFLTIKKDIDENRINGRYLLTGSANPLLIPKLGDSLAGRMEIFDLYPLSQGELINVREKFIDTVFNSKTPKAFDMAKEELLKKIFIGGYPTIQKMDNESRDEWFSSYITTILSRDVQDLANIAGLTELPRLLNILATRVGNLLNVSDLSRSSGISATTLHRYLTLLQTLFIINYKLPWSSNLGKTFVKSPKLYLVDSGLLTFLLNINSEKLKLDNKILGPILENFIVNELTKQATWSDTKIKIYHFRTSTGIEVDVILEDRAGNIVAIEIKASETVTSSDFKGLKYFKELAGNRFIQGFVVYTGTEIIPFDKHLHAIPVSSLWSEN